MEVLAAIYVGLYGVGTVLYPLVWGKKREPETYGPRSWLGHVIEGLFIVPICGRVLGWW